MAVVLHGYKYSVYLRIVRLVLAEKGVAYTQVEVNPFAQDVSQDYLDLNPFGHVPTLVHNNFVVYETCAITRYIDDAFKGPQLQPGEVKKSTRMMQIIAIIDSYAYWPLVRQVFSHRVFKPAIGNETDENEISQGLKAAARALGALEIIVAEGLQLTPQNISLADLHLAPIISCFVKAAEGKALLSDYAVLSQWWEQIRHRQSLKDTDPGLPK